MDSEGRQNQKVVMLFVPRKFIKQCLVDVQHSYGFGFSWVRTCDFLKDDDTFAVQIVMTHPYPYLEESWKRWEAHD